MIGSLNLIEIPTKELKGQDFVTGVSIFKACEQAKECDVYLRHN